MIKQTLSLALLAIRSVLTFHVKLCGYESGYVLVGLTVTILVKDGIFKNNVKLRYE